MNSLFAKSSLRKLAAAAVFTSTALIITGCGMGTAAAPAPGTLATINGRAMGGAQPLVGATAGLWVTGTVSGGSVTAQGYGVATELQTYTTTSGGNFSFTSPGAGACPAGQYVYITVAGGQPGSNATGVNPNAVEVDALGRCEDLYNGSGAYTGQPVNLNEATTVAAAYALGRFSSVSGSGASTLVQIGADATNNAPEVNGGSVGCTVDRTLVPGCQFTAAAGLFHAFLNAGTLVNSFAGDAALATAAGGVIPTALINSIANVTTACINSNGLTSQTKGTDTTSACGQMFIAVDGGVTANEPLNTFSALVNLAANPTLAGGSVTLANFFAVSTGYTGVYTPTLSSAPSTDYSIAINYPHSVFTSVSFPQSGALDMNDDYYVGNATYTSGSPGTPVNILSFSSNGAAYGSSGTNSTIKSAFSLAVDAVGDGYIANGGNSGSNNFGLFPYFFGVTGSTAVTTAGISGVHTSNDKVYAVAIDKQNNVWAFGTIGTNGTSTIYENPGPYTSSAPAAKTWVPIVAPGPVITVPTAGYVGLAIDPNQNIWVDSSSNLSVVENNGTGSAPTYTNTTIATATTGGSPAVGITFTGTSTSYKAWVSSYQVSGATPGIQPFTPTYDATNSNVGVTAATAGTFEDPSSITGSFYNEADGAGTVWVADTNSSSIQAFNTSTNTAAKLLPCLVGSGTCSSVFTGGKPYDLSIDSTGSIWVVVPGASGGGNVVQIIGSAAPTWPLLSLGQPGGVIGTSTNLP